MQPLFRKYTNHLRRGAERKGLDGITLSGASFLLLFWEKFFLSPTEAAAWLKRTIKSDSDVVTDSLVDEHTIQGRLQLPQLVESLFIWTMSAIGAIEDPNFLSQRQRFIFQPPGILSIETICARTLFYASQMTLRDGSESYFLQLRRCGAQTLTEEQQLLHVLAFAVLCGYGDDEAPGNYVVWESYR